MTGTRPAPHTGVPGAPSSGRLVGVDVARAVALLGMIAAHVGDVAEQVNWADPASWSAVVNGRSAALFAVLAGVSIGLVSGREAPPGPPTIGRIRARLALRAVVVVAVGLLLMTLGTPVYVVLPTYGALFLLALPVLRWRPWALLVLAAACALASAPVVIAVLPVYADAGMAGVQLGLVYPVVTFAAYVFVGLAVARTRSRADGTDTVRHVVLLLAAAGVAVAAYVVGAVAAPVPADTTGAFPGGALRAGWLGHRAGGRAGVPVPAGPLVVDRRRRRHGRGRRRRDRPVPPRVRRTRSGPRAGRVPAGRRRVDAAQRLRAAPRRHRGVAGAAARADDLVGVHRRGRAVRDGLAELPRPRTARTADRSRRVGGAPPPRYCSAAVSRAMLSKTRDRRGRASHSSSVSSRLAAR
ncbi:heparan-alpha-glucosaminide N-acetyltransferase domain-containing protein [Curtobacterium sp. MCJR17_043]|uniref:heparan-alpha-glucosaminide N-acetyltransferase domain-containing protein n=1 Tax=Curtobacterium sp. MCJR17_043 TaxID=2175660 RepID=UPI0024DF6DFD|nr:heparan-alpha-glucosaminide N-acetyltransferase domain-containing protein [Curtobacterium sp. MCJR17_043]WIB35370.1 heparan-alpha-glucosaminide N-acetyltransferase domain-containing protein [Curtobacterium sp. MCJR17_043]